MAALFCRRNGFISRCILRSLPRSLPKREYHVLRLKSEVPCSTGLLLRGYNLRNNRCERWKSDEPTKGQGEGPVQNENENVSIVLSRGPIRWLSNKIKLFLVRSYFDADFDETTFLEGAKQAICTVSSLVSQQKFNELEGLLTTEAIEIVRQEVIEKQPPKSYEITMEDILQIVVHDIGFQYDEVEKGRKWLHVLVSYICRGNEELPQKDVANITFIRIPFPKITRYSFRKECTKDADDDWIITKVTHMNQDGLDPT